MSGQNLRFKCVCSKSLAVPPRLLGKKCKCPRCSRTLKIPQHEHTKVSLSSARRVDLSKPPIPERTLYSRTTWDPKNELKEALLIITNCRLMIVRHSAMAFPHRPIEELLAMPGTDYVLRNRVAGWSYVRSAAHLQIEMVSGRWLTLKLMPNITDTAVGRVDVRFSLTKSPFTISEEPVGQAMTEFWDSSEVLPALKAETFEPTARVHGESPTIPENGNALSQPSSAPSVSEAGTITIREGDEGFTFNRSSFDFDFLEQDFVDCLAKTIGTEENIERIVVQWGQEFTHPQTVLFTPVKGGFTGEPLRAGKTWIREKDFQRWRQATKRIATSTLAKRIDNSIGDTLRWLPKFSILWAIVLTMTLPLAALVWNSTGTNEPAASIAAIGILFPLIAISGIWALPLLPFVALNKFLHWIGAIPGISPLVLVITNRSLYASTFEARELGVAGEWKNPQTQIVSLRKAIHSRLFVREIALFSIRLLGEKGGKGDTLLSEVAARSDTPTAKLARWLKDRYQP